MKVQRRCLYCREQSGKRIAVYPPTSHMCSSRLYEDRTRATEGIENDVSLTYDLLTVQEESGYLSKQSRRVGVDSMTQVIDRNRTNELTEANVNGACFSGISLK